MAVRRELPIPDQDRAGLETRRARWAKSRAARLLSAVRLSQTACVACGHPLAPSRGVLFQGDHLVHAACWRNGPKPFDAQPAR